jgi:NADH dehydrogenase (ubiquinone) Fe-S protein 1
VDGKKVSVPADFTVLQACEAAGAHIPRFCYHDRLSIAGNCRMCLVEVVKSPKPVASCAMPLMPNMAIKTDTPLVKKAREGVMEFLLANHPLDCPICDQGGECDLQDQSVTFGSDRSRFREIKRSVEDKNLGPFVKTIMTRCIHCTRCVRFAEEIAGVEDLGVTGRGNSMEIGTYVEKVFDSEVSGNVVDVCPVGALTSRPFAFTARPWELRHIETIDVLDAVGANIRVDVRGNKVLRILPRLNEEVNEEWIGDKSRYAYDGLQRQRLDTPMIKDPITKELVPVSWEKALTVVGEQISKVKGSEIKAIAGDLVDAESLIALKDLVNRLGSDNTECRQDGAAINADIRSNYIFNSRIVGIEEADAILLVGTNPRMEGPLINTRLKKASLQGEVPIAYVGPEFKSTFPIKHLGKDLSVLDNIAISGAVPGFEAFAKAKRPLVIFGLSTLRSDLGGDASYIYSLIPKLGQKFPIIQDGWNGVSFLQQAGARTAALDIGFVPGSAVASGPGKLYYLLGADEFDEDEIPADAFVIYQGHHGDKGASRADVILPGQAYTEKAGTYVNTEGRVQQGMAAVTAPFDSREDWMIIRALSEVLGIALPYDTVEGVRARLADVAPHFATLWEVETPSFVHFSGAEKKAPTQPLKPSVENYWFTNPIARVSKTLAKANQQLPTATNSYVKN